MNVLNNMFYLGAYKIPLCCSVDANMCVCARWECMEGNYTKDYVGKLPHSQFYMSNQDNFALVVNVLSQSTVAD